MNAKREAIQNLAKVADDWGWKGGKPGELTAGEYMELRNEAARKAKRAMVEEDDMIDEVFADYDYYLNELMSKPRTKAMEQFQSSTNPYFKSITENIGMSDVGDHIDTVMGDLASLEQAGIPREWTGKVLPAIRSQLQQPYDEVSFILAKHVSDLMRPMTNEQRQTFLNLLPRWTGTLETAASAAKKLYRP